MAHPDPAASAAQSVLQLAQDQVITVSRAAEILGWSVEQVRDGINGPLPIAASDPVIPQ